MSAFRAARCFLTIAPTGRAAFLPYRLPSYRLSPGIATSATCRRLHLQDNRPYNSSALRQKNTKREEHHHEDLKDQTLAVSPQFDKKTNTRSATSKSTLRRVASSNDRSKHPQQGTESDGKLLPTQICTAYCTAEKYNLRQCNSLLKSGGYVPDPLSTGLGDEVIHLRLPLPPQTCRHFPTGADSYGDIFVFPSGNIVSWGIPEAIITSVAALIRPAAESPHSTTETETLEFVEDPNRSASFLRGDVITIGTGTKKLEEDTTHHSNIISISNLVDPMPSSLVERRQSMREREEAEESSRRQATPTVLAKIAFSSGLARSTKLAVLEELLESYIESTAIIPKLLSQGSRLPFTRNFILRKTGELLSFRARLNLYSELTDSLPDIFWDSRKELGLEGYYDSVGRELDVGVRIRQLNEKLDYASEMAAVLRERLSERHGLVLEWMIIILITIEVGFEILHLWKDSKEEQRREEMERQMAAPPPAPLYSQPIPHPPVYQNYPHYDHHHQHHQHQRPFQGYYDPHLPPPPQQPQQPYHSQPQNLTGRRMDDIDIALMLLDSIIAKALTEEEVVKLKEKNQKKENDE
ncbi:hypothetical protein ABW20_dc0105411 [Dactylellina cionopaga]|nr:hypothetical protein ABW20_dc0105411 [Dactylellina cionopaga]